MRHPLKWLVIFIIIFSLTFSSWGIYGEINYDLTYQDAEGDVVLFEESGFTKVTGHENIDILSIESSKQTVGQTVVLEMNVIGIIKNSEEIQYHFTIFDGEEMVYMVMYQNGSCRGYNSNDMGSEPDILITTGEGTDTLKVTIPIKNLGVISDYDFMGSAIEIIEEDETFIIYMDEVPDQDTPPWDNGNGDYWVENPVFITNPKDGGTVFEKCEIKGTTNIEDYDMEQVEIQIDSKSSSGWELAITSDNWETWNYQWDTDSMQNGQHTINARAFDSETEDYYYDSIIIYINQQAATAPESTNLPVFRVGDRYEYRMKMYGDSSGLPEGASVSGSMTISIVDTDTIEVNGTMFDVYIFKVYSKQEMSSGFGTFKGTTDGKVWVRTSDLTDIKEDMTYEYVSSGFGSTEKYSNHDISTYDPPNDKYQFPVKVAEKWETTTSKYTKSTEESDGETETYEYTETVIGTYECLRTDTISVPAGTFDVFVSYSEIEYVDEDWEDNDENYTDTDGDGWSDEDEEFFGTDPDNPEDYPDEMIIEDEEEYSYESYGYEIEYYSPEIGFLIKMESYDYDRQLTISFELVSYKYGDKSYEPSDDGKGESSNPLFGGYELPIYYLLIIFLVIVIIIITVIISRKRRRRKLEAQLTAQRVKFESVETPSTASVEVQPYKPPQQPRA